ncbi:hypothetical protein F4678DRAFT_443150 [Xylaria arbuscula]|nr:hypothetical protein F4678DRAFT_443150 [Xylaria arbuscula]
MLILAPIQDKAGIATGPHLMLSFDANRAHIRGVTPFCLLIHIHMFHVNGTIRSLGTFLRFQMLSFVVYHLICLYNVWYIHEMTP